MEAARVVDVAGRYHDVLIRRRMRGGVEVVVARVLAEDISSVRGLETGGTVHRCCTYSRQPSLFTGQPHNHTTPARRLVSRLSKTIAHRPGRSLWPVSAIPVLRVRMDGSWLPGSIYAGVFLPTGSSGLHRSPTPSAQAHAGSLVGKPLRIHRERRRRLLSSLTLLAGESSRVTL